MSDVILEETGTGYLVNGQMNFDTVNHLLTASSKLFETKQVLDIDLRNVARADSAGLALLVEWMVKTRRRNATIRFLNMPKQMREIARMTEVDTLLPIGDSS